MVCVRYVSQVKAKVVTSLIIMIVLQRDTLESFSDLCTICKLGKVKSSNATNDNVSVTKGHLQSGKREGCY